MLVIECIHILKYLSVVYICCYFVDQNKIKIIKQNKNNFCFHLLSIAVIKKNCDQKHLG